MNFGQFLPVFLFLSFPSNLVWSTQTWVLIKRAALFLELSFSKSGGVNGIANVPTGSCCSGIRTQDQSSDQRSTPVVSQPFLYWLYIFYIAKINLSIYPHSATPVLRSSGEHYYCLLFKLLKPMNGRFRKIITELPIYAKLQVSIRCDTPSKYGPFHVTCVTVWTLFSVNNWGKSLF